MLDKDAFLDIRVLDMSRVLAGPFCGMLLADMGAEVIKLEIPEKGDDSRSFPPFINEESMYYVNLNRGKKSITLNLKTEEGKELFLGIVKKCDVLLENFRPGTMKKLGLDYEVLRKVNPSLVYAAISGYGQTGPYCTRPGYDIIGQAMGGLLSITGWPDSPPTRSGTAIGDILSSLFCCIGILSALNVRKNTGEGQLVDVSLVDSVFAALENIPQKYYVEGYIPGRIGNRYEFIYPYDTFKSKDGWVVIGVANDSIWQRFVEVTSLNLENDPRFKTNPERVKYHAELKELIEKWTSNYTKKELIDLFNRNRVPACQIYDVREASEDPHIGGAREMVQIIEQKNLGMVKVQGNPIKMSTTDPRPRGPAPSLGEDTKQVLQELMSISLDDYFKLKEDGVL
jgi:formyl-CoA transferase